MTDKIAAIFTLDGLISLLTLTLLEIVLGIDNIIFISIVSSKLPRENQSRARTIGLMLALVMRVILLFSITWIISLKDPYFYISDFGVTGRDLILFSGGVFLVIKTIKEIYEKIYHMDSEMNVNLKKLTVQNAIIQIVFIDIIFSFDSILTAVGLVSNVFLMIAAVIISMVIMLVFSGAVSDFINKHPTVRMLALAFLVMIGVVLIVESLHLHLDKAYIYVALVFSLIVEMLNMAYRSNGHRRHKTEQ
jgi:predicted tellurium resistance membrane protein TerC